MKVFYSPSYCDTSVSWDTTRKAAEIARTLTQAPISGVELCAPSRLSRAELASIIEPSYLTALETGEPTALALSNGIGWDERLLSAVSASSAGARSAVLEALVTSANSGSLSSGLHHARRSGGNGYCTLNGLALAAIAALEAGASRVLILDLDAHAGGGTASYLVDQSLAGVEQLDVSVIPFDTYQSTSRSRLVMSSPPAYLSDIAEALGGVRTPASIDVVIYNAGMDPCQFAGGPRGITPEDLQLREQLVFQWAASHGLPVAWVLAGGYTTGVSMDELTALHLLTIRAALP